MNEQKQERGSITVFLSLILLILISIVTQVMQEAMFQADRIKLASAMDVSLNAVLGEYCKELVEEYGLFFLDASDENGVFDKENVASRLDYYMYKNVQEQSGMLQMQLIDTEIKNITLATDNDGMAFFEEAVKAYKEKIVAKVVESAMQQSKKYEQAEKARETIEKNQVEPSELEIPKDIEVNLEEKEKAEKIVNPVEVIEALKANGLLGIVAWDIPISGNSIDLSTTLQKRKLNQGNCQKKQKSSVSEQVIFDLYLKDQFSHFGNRQQDGESCCLEYEIEYLVSGRAGDKENLSAVLEKIIWMREGINFAYLLTDKTKMAEADALATALVGYTGIAPLVVAMKFAILAVWAYGESLLEIRILLKGGKVDFIKSESNWKLQLSELANVATIIKGESQGDEQGMAYEDYLWILLSASSKKDKCYRSMDLIEKRIQNITNVTSFRMDNCVSYMEGEVSAISRCGRSITVSKTIEY
ncbi:MAG: hypothetical protein IJF03_00715 [Lachnospiraceae bacterium]|nr:hypothetical protein [Lachnospiraceae bacterium]